jgi:hypothetical protein
LLAVAGETGVMIHATRQENHRFASGAKRGRSSGQILVIRLIRHQPFDGVSKSTQVTEQ